MKKQLLLIISLLSVFMLMLASCSNPALGPYDKELADKLLVPNGKYVNTKRKYQGEENFTDVINKNPPTIVAEGNKIDTGTLKYELKEGGVVVLVKPNNTTQPMPSAKWEYKDNVFYFTYNNVVYKYEHV